MHACWEYVSRRDKMEMSIQIRYMQINSLLSNEAFSNDLYSSQQTPFTSADNGMDYQNCLIFFST